MSTFTYIVFHTDTYQTSHSYAESLMFLTKEQILLAAAKIGVKLTKSQNKAAMALQLSDYVLQHPEEMVAKLNPDEVLLVSELIQAGNNTIIWKQHRLLYPLLKQMVWVLVNYQKEARKDGFVMVDELRSAFAPYIALRFDEARQKKTARKNRNKARGSEDGDTLTLRKLSALLKKLPNEHLKIVHHLFMHRFINFCDYSFADEWFYDLYCEAYSHWFSHPDNQAPCPVDDYLITVLKEWRKNRYTHYIEAMEILSCWMQTDWTDFTSIHQPAVQQAWEKGMLHNDSNELAVQFTPFVEQVKNLVKQHQYHEAVCLLFCLFHYFGKANQQDESWFSSFLYGHPKNKITACLEQCRYLYCHIRQLNELTEDYTGEMDIHLQITNYQHSLFGIGCEFSFCSQSLDMISDGIEQYGKYTSLEALSL